MCETAATSAAQREPEAAFGPSDVRSVFVAGYPSVLDPTRGMVRASAAHQASKRE